MCHFQAHSDWQNSVPCSFSTELSISLLAGSQELLSGSRDSQYSLSSSPFHLQAKCGMSNPSFVSDLCEIPFYHLEKILCF